MTLDEHLAQIIGKLEACRDPLNAHVLLAEVELVLATGKVSDAGQKAFWETLTGALDDVAQTASLCDQQALAEVDAVIAAAHAAIAEYQALVRGKV